MSAVILLDQLLAQLCNLLPQHAYDRVYRVGPCARALARVRAVLPCIGAVVRVWFGALASSRAQLLREGIHRHLQRSVFDSRLVEELR